ncbi:bcl-2-related ovarian killer protein homolog B [Aplochiton taeniatus]
MEVLRRSSVLAAEVIDVFDRSLSEKELVSQSKALCRDYIHSRLSQAGLNYSSELNFPRTPSSLSEVSGILLCLGDELECMRPGLYRNVARQLNISVASESLVSDALIAVATEIFSTGITWGKVVSVYAVAGALAVDCVRQGQLAVVYTIVASLGQFVRKFLAAWLKRRGGWHEIAKCVVKLEPSPGSNDSWLTSATDSLKYFLTTLYVYVMKEQ